MKIIVEISYSDLMSRDEGVEEIYKEEYAEKGFLFSELAEAIYYIVESPFMPREGDLVATKVGYRIVEWAVINMLNEDDYHEYFDYNRIVVKEE